MAMSRLKLNIKKESMNFSALKNELQFGDRRESQEENGKNEEIHCREI